MTNLQQQVLNLFPENTFEQLIKNLNEEKRLSIQISKRMKSGWHVKINKFNDKRVLTIPQSLQIAPENVKHALIKWALLPFPRSKRRKQTTIFERKQLEHFIHGYLHDSGTICPTVTSIKRELLDKKCQGIKFNLREIFDTINKTYFNNSIHSYVRWGTKGSTTSYQTARTSSDGVKWNLITIAGVYNHHLVPLFAIESVMYHEMLHIAIPPYKKNGRNIIHGKEFKAAERKYPYFYQWQEWEKKEVRKLSRELRSPKNH